MQDLQVAVAAVDNLIQGTVGAFTHPQKSYEILHVGPRGKEAYQTLWTTLNKMAHQITEVCLTCV